MAAMVVIDVGDDKVVTLVASPAMDRAAELLATYESTILAVAGMVRYTAPEPRVSPRDDLPRVFGDC